jgi:RimJ/RimL family protein N-acetyltransferase
VGAKDFARLKTVSSGSWLGRDHQGKGYGKEMRAAMLHFVFEGLGAEVAESEAWEENAASIGVSTSLGYERNGIKRRPHPRGEGYVTAIEFRLTKERWQETDRPEVTIEGLEDCLEMFGAGAQ